MKKLMVLFVAVTMTGCAANYVEPTSGSLATFISSGDTRDFPTIEQVRFGIVDSKTGCGDLYKNKSKSNGLDTISYKVPAPESLFAAYSYVSGPSFCHVALSFETEIGKTYEAEGGLTNGGCVVSVMEKAEGEYIKVETKSASVSIMSGNEACLED